MKPLQVLDTLFKVLMTAAAVKAAMGTLISPMRGKHPIPGRTVRGTRPIELGDLPPGAELLPPGAVLIDDGIEYEDLL